MKPAQAQQPLPKPKAEQPPPSTPLVPPPDIEWVLDPSGWILGKNRRTVCMILPTVSLKLRTMIAEAPKTLQERDRLLAALKDMLAVATVEGPAVENARALVDELTPKEPDGNDQ